MELLLATRNEHKTREFAALLGAEFQVTDLSREQLLSAVAETGRTFEENAMLKAAAVSQDRQVLVVADDSGLEVDALAGRPGIFSARYAGEMASDRQNVEKLLRELSRPPAHGQQRSARFRCAVALAYRGKILNTFDGTVEGVISEQPRGSGGFGYDPVFIPRGFEETFGELPAEIKNRISHRAKAVLALREALRHSDRV